MTLAAIAAGKQVFCEKPLATSLPEATAVARAASARRVRLSVDYVLCWNPLYRLLQHLQTLSTPTGAPVLGRPRHFAFQNLAHDDHLPRWTGASRHAVVSGWIPLELQLEAWTGPDAATLLLGLDGRTDALLQAPGFRGQDKNGSRSGPSPPTASPGPGAAVARCPWLATTSGCRPPSAGRPRRSMSTARACGPASPTWWPRSATVMTRSSPRMTPGKALPPRSPPARRPRQDNASHHRPFPAQLRSRYECRPLRFDRVEFHLHRPRPPAARPTARAVMDAGTIAKVASRPAESVARNLGLGCAPAGCCGRLTSQARPPRGTPCRRRLRTGRGSWVARGSCRARIGGHRGCPVPGDVATPGNRAHPHGRKLATHPSRNQIKDDEASP
jgi:Oxidoreductase family, NAD-binding Rossmann fold